MFKFGDLRDFILFLSKGLKVIEHEVVPSVVMSPSVVSPVVVMAHSAVVVPLAKSQPIPININYSSIAKNNDKTKNGFSIKLLDCDDNNDNSFSESASPFRKSIKTRLVHFRIAALFHTKQLEHIPARFLKEVDFSSDYSEADRAGISDLILKNDAFMI